MLSRLFAIGFLLQNMIGICFRYMHIYIQQTRVFQTFFSFVKSQNMFFVKAITIYKTEFYLLNWRNDYFNLFLHMIKRTLVYE